VRPPREASTVELDEPADDPFGAFVRLRVLREHASRSNTWRGMIREDEVADTNGLDRNLLDSTLERRSLHELRGASASKVFATHGELIRAEFAHYLHEHSLAPLSMRTLSREHDRPLERALHHAAR
jgi:hypothetical protein